MGTQSLWGVVGKPTGQQVRAVVGYRWAVGLGTRVGVDMEVGEGVGMGVALRWE